MPGVPACGPVRLGTEVDLDGHSLSLHVAARHGSLRQAERAMAAGVEVDVTNSEGQSPLYVAALLGHQHLVRALLAGGASPGLRSGDGSTPVHAAALSDCPTLLAELLQAGGDLRLRDRHGRSAQEWGQRGGGRRKMVELLSRCQARMSLLLLHCESTRGQELLLNGCGKGALPRPSLLARLWTRNSQPDCRSSPPGYCCLGFGKLCRCGYHGLGLWATVPLVCDRELISVDSEPDLTYPNGPFTLMCSRVWEGQRVTVRQLAAPSHPHCTKAQGTVDLLIHEQQHSSHLRHPGLLLLMAVCVSESLHGVRLVYERVGLGSLYTLLHTQGGQRAGIGTERAATLLSQVCDAVIYLHARGCLHRCLSSHAVQLVGPHRAKLTNLEYLHHGRLDSVNRRLASPPVPHQLHNWLPPEIIGGFLGSERSDIYSLCAVTQEIYTGRIPWEGADGRAVREMMSSGRSLPPVPGLPPPLQTVLHRGTRLRQRDRNLTLQEMRRVLQAQLQELGLVAMAGPVGGNRARGTQRQHTVPSRQLGRGADTVDAAAKLQQQPAGSSGGDELCYYEMGVTSSQSDNSNCGAEGPPSSSPDSSPPRTGEGLAARGMWSGYVGTLPALGVARRESGHGHMTSGHGHRAIEPAASGHEHIDDARTSLESAPCVRGGRMRTYSVRYGCELDSHTDSSLLDSESEGSPRQRSSPHGPSPRDKRQLAAPTPLPLVTQTAATLPRPRAPVLAPAASIHESAGLLTWASCSLQRLEKSFLNGIQTLEEVANHHWELETGDEEERSETQTTDVTMISRASSLEGDQQHEEYTDHSLTIAGVQALETARDAASQTSLITLNSQLSDGEITISDLLERWDLQHSDKMPGARAQERPNIDLMQEMIDELKREPRPVTRESDNSDQGDPSPFPPRTGARTVTQGRAAGGMEPSEQAGPASSLHGPSPEEKVPDGKIVREAKRPLESEGRGAIGGGEVAGIRSPVSPELGQ